MTELCPTCRLPHKPDVTGSLFVNADAVNAYLCIGNLQGTIEGLLRNIGDLTNCTGCGDPIYWVRHKNGKRTPYTRAGLNHFVDCVARDRFKEKSA
jgi:hypothetical protein